MVISLPVIVGSVAAIAVLGLFVLAFAGPSAAKAKARRLTTVRERHAGTTEAAVAAQMRKAINSTSRKSSALANFMPRRDQLELRLRRTGKSWTVSQYMMASMALFVVVAAVMLAMRTPVLLTGIISVLLTMALPHMFIGRLIKKRVTKFTASFPDAIDLLVRGLRSGLPVTETLHIVSNEIPGPVGEEFKAVVERTRIGKTMDAALQETADLLNTPEIQFFCITIAIQRETGGNLAETLSNLSDVLRKRAQMKLKIKAMSSEAKASAYIVGCLPFFVFAIVWTMNPGYLAGFFYEERLIITGLGGLLWMSMGVAIMAKMINFEI